MSDIRYLETHEWFIETDGVIKVGISNYAQGELGDIVFVTMPDLNVEYSEGSAVVELEATKTIAEVYAPFDCKITEINLALDAQPELINSDPLVDGWLFKASTNEFVKKGMDENEYTEFIS